MRTTTFRVLASNFTIRKGSVAFYHPWRGIEVYWIVPNSYLVEAYLRMTKAMGQTWVIKINQAYFEVGVNKPDVKPLYAP